MFKLTRYLNFLHTFVCVIINQHIDCYRLAMVIFLTEYHNTTDTYYYYAKAACEQAACENTHRTVIFLKYKNLNAKK